MQKQSVLDHILFIYFITCTEYRNLSNSHSIHLPGTARDALSRENPSEARLCVVCFQLILILKPCNHRNCHLS